MAVQTRTNNTNLPLCLKNGKTRDDFTIKQYATGDLLKGQVMGKEMVIIGTVSAITGTGNGTVTGYALNAIGSPAKVGSYVLKCIDADSGDALSGSSSAVTGTGNGTVTSVVPTAPAKVGAYDLRCKDASEGGTASGSTVFTGTGNGTSSAIVANANAIAGDYIILCIDATVSGSEIFSVTTPEGVHLEDLTVGVAYSNSHLGVTLTDGGTDFIVGDFWTVTMIVEHGGKFTLTDPDGIIIEDDLVLPGGAGGTLAVDSGGLAFTITDGGTDFAADDYFTITVVGAHGGKFSLTDPDGITIVDNIQLPGGAGGTIVFTGAGLAFTITDGSTDFVLNDFFTLTTTAGVKLIPVTDAATVNGSQLPLYILGEEVDATGGDIAGNVAYTEGDFDEQQFEYEGTADIDTDIKIGNVEKTIREWLQDTGITAIDSNYIDGFENT